MKRISILGSTGSIGVNTLSLVEARPDRFAVVGLAAGSNAALLAEQVKRFRPKVVSLRSEAAAAPLKEFLSGQSVRFIIGPEGAEEVARFEENEIIVSAISGIEGLRPTLAAVRTGARVALANKESLVAAGALLEVEAEASGAEILPVDSEHSGIFQCLAKERREEVRKVILTASGGPFFRTPVAELRLKTVDEALDHPRWKMGRKVTVDSATLMNKGLELIEARWLFGLAPSQLDVLIHPQSIVHSLVEMRDGSTLAQLSPTDMRIPIQYALTYPERQASPLPPLDLGRVGTLEFFEAEPERYPLLALARLALETERSLPVALNAANEAAVGAFLDRRIGFSEIAFVVRAVVESHRPSDPESLEAILAVDREARARAENFIRKRDTHG